MRIEISHYLIWPFLIFSALLIGYALILLRKCLAKKRELTMIVSGSLALAVFLFAFSFALATGIYKPTTSESYVTEEIPVYNKDGTLKYDRYGNIVTEKFYDSIKTEHKPDNNLILAFIIGANVSAIYPIYGMKKELKKEDKQ